MIISVAWKGLAQSWTTYVVRCDECGREEGCGQLKTEDAVREARQAGWRVVGKAALCRKCQAAEPALPFQDGGGKG